MLIKQVLQSNSIGNHNVLCLIRALQKETIQGKSLPETRFALVDICSNLLETRFTPKHTGTSLTENDFTFAQLAQACLKTILPLRSLRKPAGNLSRLCIACASLPENYFAFAQLAQTCLKTILPLRSLRKPA